VALSVDWATRVITVPQADLTLTGPGVYGLDLDVFRLALKDIEDGEVGIAHPDTHRHNTEVVLSGVTYSRFVEIINGYSVTFEDTGTPYVVVASGANSNLADVVNLDGSASLVTQNSAGLVVVQSTVVVDEVAAAVEERVVPHVWAAAR